MKGFIGAWVTKYNVSDSDAGSAGNQDAYLLNVAPADAATEAANFKVTTIAINADGSVAVAVTDKNSKGDAYNGTIAIKGKAAIGDAEWTGGLCQLSSQCSFSQSNVMPLAGKDFYAVLDNAENKAIGFIDANTPPSR